jgi:S1-C subfamily serine protease
VVEGATKLTVETYEGEQLSVDVASQGRVADLAVLKIKKGIGQAALLAADDPAAGQHIRAFGYSGGGPMRVTEGLVRGYTADWELGNKGQVIQATVEIRPGNSGGPALDDDGRVIGVVYAIELQSKLALIVPLSTLKGVLKNERLLQPVKAC